MRIVNMTAFARRARIERAARASLPSPKAQILDPPSE